MQQELKVNFCHSKTQHLIRQNWRVITNLNNENNSNRTTLLLWFNNKSGFKKLTWPHSNDSRLLYCTGIDLLKNYSKFYPSMCYNNFLPKINNRK